MTCLLSLFVVMGHTSPTTLHQNYIQEIESILNLGNTCYHSLQSILSSYLLSMNIKIKICTTILPVVLYGHET